MALVQGLSFQKIAIGLIMATVGAEATYYMVKWLFQKNRRHKYGHCGNAGCSDILEVIFFPDGKPTCQDHYRNKHGCVNNRCRYSHENTSFTRLMRHIYTSRHSLDLCVFTITNPELASAVIDLHNRGVIVRVITDDEQLNSSGSQIGRFRAEGIQVRHDRSPFFMHHKFVLLDGQLLINGSFNWTRQAVTGNQENVLITNRVDIVTAYKREYEKLWTLFDPRNHCD